MFKLQLIFAGCNASVGNFTVAGLCVAAAVVSWLFGDESDE